MTENELLASLETDIDTLNFGNEVHFSGHPCTQILFTHFNFNPIKSVTL
jgi:hypothetical protein